MRHRSFAPIRLKRAIGAFARCCGAIATGLGLLSTVASSAPPLSPSTFAYEPLHALPAVVHEERKDGVIVREIVIPAGPFHGSARKALVVLPPGRGPFAGALMVHWLGDERTSNRTEFLADAKVLALHGVVSVLPDAMWSAHHWYDDGRSYATDYPRSIDQVRDLRRAMDVLLLQPGVDRSRIAYVGHDFGGMYGAVFAGVDHRARYYVIMCATAAFSDWYLYTRPPRDKAAYIAQMSTLDPTRYLAIAPITAALFQFARHDFYVPPAKMRALYAADPGAKSLRVYPAKHDLQSASAISDRRRWLQRYLSRDGSSAAR